MKNSEADNSMEIELKRRYSVESGAIALLYGAIAPLDVAIASSHCSKLKE
ncbi:uncharacterized protein G2W53_004006 [Senna tora]|uniref:Uncharacterized protein n=1 Tax=Senna tora TaxID=362788 RepID=A0A834XEH8_9FABA|nr:uncharacterized protein G2W53_004006 [Senna tora]